MIILCSEMILHAPSGVDDSHLTSHVGEPDPIIRMAELDASNVRDADYEIRSDEEQSTQRAHPERAADDNCQSKCKTCHQANPSSVNERADVDRYALVWIAD